MEKLQKSYINIKNNPVSDHDSKVLNLLVQGNAERQQSTAAGKVSSF